MGDFIGSGIGVIQGYARSLGYSSCLFARGYRG